MKEKTLLPTVLLCLMLLGVPPAAAEACPNVAAALNTANPMVTDEVNNNLFVADTSNNRVLVFEFNPDQTVSTTTPLYVLGQPDLDHCLAGTSQSAMDHPSSLAVDAVNKRLFVADKQNNRVLVFSTAALRNGLPAVNVLGQADFTSQATGATLASMDHPRGLVFDPRQNRLFVVDANNGTRVLSFSVSKVTDGMSATRTLGPTEAVMQLPKQHVETTPSDLETPRSSSPIEVR